MNAHNCKGVTCQVISSDQVPVDGAPCKAEIVIRERVIPQDPDETSIEQMAKRYGELAGDALCERMRSGEYTSILTDLEEGVKDLIAMSSKHHVVADLDGDTKPVPDYRAGLMDFLQRRMDRLKSDERFVFFTFREDEAGGVYVSWPVSGYQNIPARIIHKDQRTIKAIGRISRRSHIKAITVVGPMRTYDQYFPWIKAQYEV